MVNYQLFVMSNFECAQIIKSYLRYKTIASQNVTSEAQIKNFFISKKKYVPFWKY